MTVWPRIRIAAETPVILGALTAGITLLASQGSFTIQAALAAALISLVMVLALSVFTGGSGVFSFGHVAFMAIGAYGTALLGSSPMSKDLQLDGPPSWLMTSQINPVLAVLISAGASAAVAMVVGLALMRLNGLSAGLATLALLIVVRVILQNWNSYTNGTSGLLVDGGAPSFALLLAWVLAMITIVWMFRRSKLGLRLMASREDESAARSVGISVYWERVLAFVVSAFIAGVSGGLFALYFQSISPDSFFLSATLTIIAMLVVGGATSLSGAVIGTWVVAALIEGLRAIEDSIGRPGVSEAGLCTALLVILFLRPEGLTRGRELRLPRRRCRSNEHSVDSTSPVAATAKS